MKKLLLSILTLATAAASAQNVTIPDANFKAYLVGNSSINTNSDTEIQVTEASAYTGAIDCSDLGISDLTGIEAFTSLTILYCQTNSLSTIDVSANTSLIRLYCYENQLTDLDVSANTALDRLLCNLNDITSLDLTSNTNLTMLNCAGNLLTSLDASTCTILNEFSCDGNQLTSLNIPASTTLQYLVCKNNNLTSLDVSVNSALHHLYCDNNQLNYLNVANGNNANFTQFFAQNNPNLSCIQVDGVAFSSTNWTNIDPASSFNSFCSVPPPCTVNIPDANFKAYLVGNTNTSINTNGDTEIQCDEASAFTGQIDCSYLGITDLTGIEAFTALTVLRCNNNSLNTLDVSANTALTELRCNNNSLSSLDVSANTALLDLACANNPLGDLNVVVNTAIEVLDCRNNSLTGLNVSSNTALRELTCSNNLLGGLDLSAFPDLEWFECDNGSLTSLDIANGNNSNFTWFYTPNNPDLTCIQVDDAAYSTTNWTNIDGTSSFSENCLTVGIEEEETFSFGMYPNPTNGVFTISSSETVQLVEVFNHVGQKVADFGEVNTIDISNLSDGVYTVKATSYAKIGVARLIKQ